MFVSSTTVCDEKYVFNILDYQDHSLHKYCHGEELVYYSVSRL